MLLKLVKHYYNYRLTNGYFVFQNEEINKLKDIIIDLQNKEIQNTRLKELKNIEIIKIKIFVMN